MTSSESLVGMLKMYAYGLTGRQALLVRAKPLVYYEAWVVNTDAHKQLLVLHSLSYVMLLSTGVIYAPRIPRQVIFIFLSSRWTSDAFKNHKKYQRHLYNIIKI